MMNHDGGGQGLFLIENHQRYHSEYTKNHGLHKCLSPVKDWRVSPIVNNLHGSSLLSLNWWWTWAMVYHSVEAPRKYPLSTRNIVMDSGE